MLKQRLRAVLLLAAAIFVALSLAAVPAAWRIRARSR